MEKCSVIVTCKFKKGMEAAGRKIVEKEIVPTLLKAGSTGVRLLQDLDDGTHFSYIASWNSVEDARGAQAQWEEKAKGLKGCCTNTPHREFFREKAAG